MLEQIGPLKYPWHLGIRVRQIGSDSISRGSSFVPLRFTAPLKKDIRWVEFLPPRRGFQEGTVAHLDHKVLLA